MPNLATHKTCTGCAACVDACNFNAISFECEIDGHYYPHVNTNLCVNCRSCERVCPILSNTRYGNNEQFTSMVYAGWCKNDELRKKSATSGIFASIAQYIIGIGGYVVGVIIDGMYCNYIITNNIDDIKYIQGSKYMYSNPQGIYKKIKLKLAEGKSVLFSGLPCHCAALLSYIPSKYKKQLLTIDLICGGVPSRLLIDKFNESTCNKLKKIISFRDKVNGWKASGFRYKLVCEMKDSSFYVQKESEKNLITDGFACELTNRYSCYNCNFAFFDRKSDLTIGDLWNDKIFTTEHYNGISCIIVHSEKGMSLVKKADIALADYNKYVLVKNNTKIVDGKSFKKSFFARRHMVKFFHHMSYDALCVCYAAEKYKKNIKLLIYAVLRFLYFKLDKIARNYRVNHIIKTKHKV